MRNLSILAFVIRLTITATTIIATTIIATHCVYSQTLPFWQKREYSSSIGKSFIVEMCDSGLVGRFIGSPPQSLFELFPQPHYDGQFIGKLNNGLWCGNWNDALYRGKFAVQFTADYSGFKGAFYREPQHFPEEWETISGQAIDEIWTLEGRRSPAVAGINSLFAAGAGHWYNRQYDKANTYGVVDLGLLGIGGLGSLLFLGNLGSAIITGSFSSGGIIGINIAQIALAGLIGVRVASIIDAVISAQRINEELNAQPLLPCIGQLPILEGIRQIDSSYRTSFPDVLADSTRPVFWRTARNSVFAELGGAGILGSVNYERLVTDFCGLRAGFLTDGQNVTVIPVSVNFLVGSHIEHKCELGVGITTTISYGNVLPIYQGTIGYRYQAASNGVLFRAVFTPLFGVPTGATIFPWGGVSIGYTW